MRSICLPLLALAGLSPLFGQDPAASVKGAIILGLVSDGSPSLPAPPRVMPDFHVLGTAEHPVSEGTLTFTWVAPPNVSPPPPKPEPTPLSPEEEAALAKLPPEIFLSLSATVFEHRLTHLRWHHGNEEFRAWSNIDFNHLSIGGFQVGEQRYGLYMGLGNAFPGDELDEAAKKVLPFLEGGEPRFALIAGDVSNVAALAPMEALHDIYAKEGARLREAHGKREAAEAARQRWLAENPPPPLHTRVYFWPGKENPPTVRRVPPVMDQSYLRGAVPPVRALKDEASRQARLEQRANWLAKLKKPSKPTRS